MVDGGEQENARDRSMTNDVGRGPVDRVWSARSQRANLCSLMPREETKTMTWVPVAGAPTIASAREDWIKNRPAPGCLVAACSETTHNEKVRSTRVFITNAEEI
jgi:hypothetical protein